MKNEKTGLEPKIKDVVLKLDSLIENNNIFLNRFYKSNFGLLNFIQIFDNNIWEKFRSTQIVTILFHYSIFDKNYWEEFWM